MAIGGHFVGLRIGALGTGVAAAAVLALVLIIGSSASLAGQTARETSGLEGVASCAGTTCHGRMEADGVIVRQDELMRWQEPSTPGGAHSRAFTVLSYPRARQITATLGLGDPTAAPACLGCHTTRRSAARRGGVSCPGTASDARLAMGRRRAGSRRITPSGQAMPPMYRAA